ncbi:hypothetical protein OC842_005891, partial [Tilletia horrida]
MPRPDSTSPHTATGATAATTAGAAAAAAAASTSAAAAAAAAAALRPRPRFPLQPGRALAKARLHSLPARIHYTLFPLLVYAHVPATVFLDYNAIFVLAQIASKPETSPDGVGAVSGSAAVWWFALAVYALSDLIWLIGVTFVYEGLMQFGSKWST